MIEVIKCVLYGRLGTDLIMPKKRTVLTMPQRRGCSDVDQGRAIAWLQKGVGVHGTGRRLAVAHLAIQTLRSDECCRAKTIWTPNFQIARRFHFLVCFTAKTINCKHTQGQLPMNAKVSVSDQTIHNCTRKNSLSAMR